MGLLALGTWWLVRNAPMPQLPAIDCPKAPAGLFYEVLFGEDL